MNLQKKQILKLFIKYLLISRYGICEAVNMALMRNKAAARYEKYLDAEAKDYLQKLKLLADEIEKILDQRAKDGKLTPLKALNVQDRIKTLMTEFRIGLLMDMKALVRRSAKLGIYHEIQTLKQVMPSKYQIKEEIDLKTNIAFNTKNTAIYKNTLDYLKKHPTAGEGLSSQVWQLTNNVRRRINKSIFLNAQQGISAKDMAKEIRTYLTYTGKVGRGIYKSEYKNLMRLVRNEGRTAYNQGYRQYTKSKDWITGIEIKRRGSQSCDICDPLEGKYYFKNGEPPIPPFHPHCMCYQISIIKDDVLGAEKGVSKVPKFKTPEEAIKYMKKNFVRYADELNLGKIKDLRTLNMIAGELDKMINQYGFRPNFIGTHKSLSSHLRRTYNIKKSFSTKDVAKFWRGTVEEEHYRAIIFNEKHWANFTELQKTAKYYFKEGFISNKNPASFIWHEYGHLIDDISKSSSKYVKQLKNLKTWCNNYGYDGMSNSISGYAAEYFEQTNGNLLEPISELFVRYKSNTITDNQLRTIAQSLFGK